MKGDDRFRGGHRVWPLLARWVLVIVLLLLPAGVVQATDSSVEQIATHPVSIDRAVSFGLKHNPLLGAANDQRLGAEQGVNAARSEFLPKIDAEYRTSHLGYKPIAKIPNFGGTGETASFQTSDTTVNYWGITLTQPIFKGFGLSAQYEIARLDVALAEHQMQQTRLDLVLDIQRSFIQVLRAQQVHEVVLQTIKQLEYSKHNAQSYYRQGLTPENDVLKADVTLADARQREKEVAKQVEVLRAQLNRLLGIDDGVHLDLVAWDKAPPSDEGVAVAPPLADLYSLAESRRPELLSIETAARQAKEKQRLAESKYYPQLSLVANANREGDDFFATRNDFANNENTSIGLRVDWNLFEGGKTHANVSRIKYQLRAIEKTREDFLRQIHVQVEDSRKQLEVARANLKTAQVAVSQAEENRRITLAQYREQVIVFSEVLDAEVYLTRARTNYLEALYGYQLAWVDLERATGGNLPSKPGAVAHSSRAKHAPAE